MRSTSNRHDRDASVSYGRCVLDRVDPFLGTGATDLVDTTGLAATWWRPKPPVGNTHPGATHPFGMVSACSYSGAYPTGYGVYDLTTSGMPPRRFEQPAASGFTHFQQSGTGAIRKYYNYFRVTPMLEPLDELGTRWALVDESATPGTYATTLDSGIRCEVTVGPRSAVHRYTFPASDDARIVVDPSHGGLDIELGKTNPLRARVELLGPGVAQSEIVVEGTPLAAHIECEAPGWRHQLWYDRRLVHGGTRLDLDHIRPTMLRPFGIMWRGPTHAGQSVEIRLGFSLRGLLQAEANLRADCGREQRSFDSRQARTERAWREHLGTVRFEATDAEHETVMATALYHSMIKPCFAADESPYWPANGPFVFDICTMWDIYRTQLPLITALFPDRAVELANALLKICEEEGNIPIGYRMARGADRFARQGSALAHPFLGDLCRLGLAGIDWEWALPQMHFDLRRDHGEEYLERGISHPITHTLDLAAAYRSTAVVARCVGDEQLADQFESLAEGWTVAFDSETGLLVDSTYYEGGRWNYSFRLLHDMATRISLAGGDEAFVALLDRFFGYGAPPVEQLGERPGRDELVAGMALDRFEGLNNEPDMDAPWAYHYAGRPDRTAEVVHAVLTTQFGAGRGGLPGNDDSGGLSSWYVLAALGLFPVPGQGVVLVNAPSFRHAEIDCGATLAIDVDGPLHHEAGAPPSFVVRAELDGTELDRSWITTSELAEATRLRIVVADTPSDWATAGRPPSVSTHPDFGQEPAPQVPPSTRP